MRRLQEPGRNTRTPTGQINHPAAADERPRSGGARRSYRGRFAPSPTGALHFGSLIAALASYLQARAHGGQWLVRIEDVDQPRAEPRAPALILEALARYGLEWDGQVMYQSRREPAYRDAMDRLLRQGDAFWCGCNRRQARAGPPGIEGPIYPGHCRNGLADGRRPRSVRVRVHPGPLRVMDAVHGPITQDLSRDVGDFVIRRGDGLFAYQLAVVVDDAAQAITEVVRGADLLSSTPRQVFLQDLLGLPAPSYLHTPLVCMADGRKLSKQHGAPPLPRIPGPPLVRALQCLGQSPPAELATYPPGDILDWGIRHWRPALIPRSAPFAADFLS